jgi:hypothetical protein
MPTILNPEGPVLAPAKSLAPRPQALKGMRIGILDNSKANAGPLLSRVAALLVEGFGAEHGITVRKNSAGVPASREILERLRVTSDIVLTGSADCGSCTSGSVQDTTSLEMLGVPTILVGTDMFRPLAEQLAGWLNLPSIQMAVTPHPLGGVPLQELDGKALALAEVIGRVALAQV